MLTHRSVNPWALLITAGLVLASYGIGVMRVEADETPPNCSKCFCKPVQAFKDLPNGQNKGYKIPGTQPGTWTSVQEAKQDIKSNSCPAETSQYQLNPQITITLFTFTTCTAVCNTTETSGLIEVSCSDIQNGSQQTLTDYQHGCRTPSE